MTIGISPLKHAEISTMKRLWGNLRAKSSSLGKHLIFRFLSNMWCDERSFVLALLCASNAVGLVWFS